MTPQTSSAVDPAVLKKQYCPTLTCGRLTELRDYADGHLPARWYDAGTDHPHTCQIARDAAPPTTARRHDR